MSSSGPIEESHESRVMSRESVIYGTRATRRLSEGSMLAANIGIEFSFLLHSRLATRDS